MFDRGRKVVALGLLLQFLFVRSSGDEARFPRCSNITDAENLVHPAPDFLQVLQGSFSLVLEMTMMNQKKTYYVEEVRERAVLQDFTVDTGSVHIRENGSLVAYYYYPPDGAMVEEMDGRCRLTGTDVPPFRPWGWWDPEPSHGDMLYGPSTLLRLAHFSNKRYLGGDRHINGVTCERWQTCEAAQSIEVYYYFSQRLWEMPESVFFPESEGRLPVQIEVLFLDVTERVQYNILSFLPFLHNPTLTETPRGESCEGMVSQVPGALLPRIPTHFSFYQEAVTNPLIDGASFGSQVLKKAKVTYSHPLSLIRLDYSPTHLTDTPYHTTGLLRVIHDFNTGVQYVIDPRLGNCTRDRIPRNFFDNNVGGMFATGDKMPTPDEFFHFDGSYALVGERSTRGLTSYLWTSTRTDIPDLSGLQSYPKAVLEYYFTKSYERTPEGVEEIDTPLRSDLFVYNVSEPLQVVQTASTNIYDFNVVRMYTEDEFQVEECFQGNGQDDSWSFLLIVFPTSKAEDMEAVRAEEDLFKEELFTLVFKYAQMSPVRIANIDVFISPEAHSKASDAVSLVLASLKVLQKAPYILSYVEAMDAPNPAPGINEQLFEGITSPGDCARLCSLEKTFECRSFHQCGDESCYLSRVEGSDGAPDYSVEGCRLWLLAPVNATLRDLPSDLAYLTLLDAITNGLLTVNLPYQGKEARLEASEALHYGPPDPLAPVRNQFSLGASSTVLRYPDDLLSQIGSLEECMTLCVSWKPYRCMTIAYLVSSQQCQLSATHYRDLGSSALKPHSNSVVFGRTYLSEYNPVFGGVALNTSGIAYSDVDHLETCARYCSEEKKISCQSFEWCHDERVCHLHAEHFLDVVDGGNYATHTSCIHFSTKTDLSFSQYPSQGMAFKQHTLLAANSDASSCAKLCLEETSPVCESFDFCSSCDEGDFEVCGEANLGTKNLCFTGTHHLGEPDAELISASHCRHYSREYFGQLDYASWVASRISNGDYTPGDMAGLAVGMLVLGVLMVVGFLYALIFIKPKGKRPLPLQDRALAFVSLKHSQGESES